MPDAASWWSAPLSPEALMIGIGAIWAVLALFLSHNNLHRLINVIAAGLAAWGFNPRPLDLFVTVEAAVPWLALLLVALARGRISLMQPVGSNHPPRLDATFLILGPSLALLLAWMSKTSFQIDLIDPTPPWIAALACAVIITGLSLFLGHKDSPHRQILFFVALLSGGYGYATTAYANMLLDDAQPRTYAVTVRDKTQESRKKVYYTVDLAPWALRPEGSRHKLDKETFAQLKPGDTVCVTVHPGRFGWRWQTVALAAGRSCPQGKTDTSS